MEWDRRDNETAKAYAAFLEYRNLGVQRSLSAVSQKLNKSIMVLARWSSPNDWVARAEAWDAEQNRRDEETRAEARKRLIERELVDYEKALGKFDDVWERTKLHERRTRRTLDDGSIVEVIELNVTDWRELTKWRDDISKQGRRALGLPDKITQSQVNVDMDLTNKSDDELRAIIEGKGGG